MQIKLNAILFSVSVCFASSIFAATDAPILCPAASDIHSAVFQANFNSNTYAFRLGDDPVVVGPANSLVDAETMLAATTQSYTKTAHPWGGGSTTPNRRKLFACVYAPYSSDRNHGTRVMWAHVTQGQQQHFAAMMMR